MSELLEVLDASALLAWLQFESGAEEVTLESSMMNSVNWSEVLQKAEQHGVAVEGMREELEALGLKLQPFGLAEAAKAAELFSVTRAHGLSLGDRACLATALLNEAVAVTAERAWSQLSGVRVRQIRQT